MDYNTSREKLKLPEYGRNVQNMVNQMLEIEDRDERTRTAFAIIDVMGNMFPHLRDVNEFKQKLWDHITIMSDFKLDIEAPYPLPDREFLEVKVDKMPYKEERIKIRHYGKLVENMIQAAIDMDDMDKRKYLAFLVANQMKRSFLKWNKDVVTDAKVFEDLRFLSNSILDYSDEDFGLVEIKEVVPNVKKRKNPNKNNSNHSR